MPPEKQHYIFVMFASDIAELAYRRPLNILGCEDDSTNIKKPKKGRRKNKKKHRNGRKTKITNRIKYKKDIQETRQGRPR